MTSTAVKPSDEIVLGEDVRIGVREEDGLFRGLAGVEIGGQAMRDPSRPMFAEIRSPDGVTLTDYRLVERTEDSGSVRLDFIMNRQAGGMMEWMVHEVRNRYNTADWNKQSQPADDTTLSLTLAPLSRTLDEYSGTGFTYQYAYASDSLPIYRILDRGTWEPGGRAVGNELWMRYSGTPVDAITTADQWYSTEWYLAQCANPNVFQFLPLQTHLQGFTFTVHETGVLVTWPNRVAHVRTLIEKRRDMDAVAHYHEHCGDLANTMTASPVEVLWFPGKFDQVARANLYERVKELVHETLHADLGMKRDRATSYGVIEEWGDADMKRYAKVGLPKLLDAGVKTVFLANHFQNNMNTFGASNMCCTVDYRVAESVGEENLKLFCDTARTAGARVEMWGNTSISTLAIMQWRKDGKEKRIKRLPKEDSVWEVLESASQPFVRNASNAIEADHYTPVFACLNLRDPAIREYWHKRWKEAHDRIGLDGVFIDSSFNLSSDKWHWIANAGEGKRQGGTLDQVHLLDEVRLADEPPSAILSQYRAYLDLVTEMQAYGYTYCGEDLGLFGISRTGPGVVKRLSNLPIWTDCYARFDPKEIADADGEPDEVYFQGLAYRLVWYLVWNIKKDELTFAYGCEATECDAPSEWHLSILQAYNKVWPYMKGKRTIVEDGSGVLYDDGKARVFWAFTDTDCEVPRGWTVHDALDGTPVAAEDAFQAARHHVYLMEPA